MIQPDSINLENPLLQSALDALVMKVKKKLDCDSKNVKANLYKLLLYEKGGHFKPHRDSEKENGQFATLIIQLPSIFKGNHLIVRHAGSTKTVQLDRPESRFEMLYAAHYTDCEHEVTPLESGYRLALVYNLVWTATSEAPSVGQDEQTILKLSSLLKEVLMLSSLSRLEFLDF